MKKTKIVLLTVGLVTLITSLISIIHPEIYRAFVDSDYIAESIGQDVISLLVAASIIFIGLRFEKVTSRMRLSAVGLLIYLAYAYAIYAFGAVYNMLFFNYMVIIGLSMFGAFWISIDCLLKLQKTQNGSFSVPFSKTIASFLIITVLLLGFIWTTSTLEYIVNQTKARETVIYVLDLSLILPLFALTAFYLLTKKKAGGYLGIVSMVKALTIGLSIVAGQLIKYLKGFEMDWFLVILFGSFTLVAFFINVMMKPDL